MNEWLVAVPVVLVLAWIMRDWIRTRLTPEESAQIPNSEVLEYHYSKRRAGFNTGRGLVDRKAEYEPAGSKSTHFDAVIAVDFETTGVKWPYHAVEIAWIELDHDLRELNRRSSLIRPPVSIPAEAMAKHGIDEHMVQDEPSLDEFIIEQCGNPFEAKNICFIGHSAVFDFKLFEPYCGRASLLCTLDLSRKVFPELPNHKLLTVAEHLEIPLNNQHRAESDLQATVEILRRIRDRERLNLEGLLALTLKKNSRMTMPFGKHKGMRIQDVPTGYLNWLVTRLETDDPLRHSIARELAERD